MNFLKSRVFWLGLVSAVLTSVLEYFQSGGSPSVWVIGFSVATVIASYFYRNAPGKAGTIAGIIGAQLSNFLLVHSEPTGVTILEVVKYIIPIIVNALGVYAQSIVPETEETPH
jgi:alpha/beta superfamily hydrolase